MRREISITDLSSPVFSCAIYSLLFLSLEPERSERDYVQLIQNGT